MPHTDLADPEAAPTGTARGLLCREVPGESSEQGTHTRTLEKSPSYEHESPPSRLKALTGRLNLPSDQPETIDGKPGRSSGTFVGGDHDWCGRSARRSTTMVT
jgi:hypothetical protein